MDHTAEILGVKEDFVSSVDIQSLPQDSLQRVADMIRMRRERILMDEEVWTEQSKQAAADDTFLLELLGGLIEDEALARARLLKAEDKTWDRVVRTFDDQSRHYRSDDAVAFEEARRRKLAKTENELNREQFYAFWRGHTSGRPTTQIDEAKQQKRLWTKTNALLREAYKHSAPPFAGDPEEMWRRGVIIPPDLQRSELRSAKDNAALSPEARALAELNLPAYHDFAATWRQQYERDLERRRKEALEEGTRMDVCPVLDPTVNPNHHLARRRREEEELARRRSASPSQRAFRGRASSPNSMRRTRTGAELSPSQQMSSPFATYANSYPFAAPM